MGMNAADVEAPEGTNVKYRLVEAEEVSDKPQPAPKRKGKLNWSEGEVDHVQAEPKPQEDPVEAKSRGHHHQKSGRGPRGGRFGGRRNQDNNGSYYNGVYVPTPDVHVTAQWAKNQIEFYFSPTNLVRDIFLRQHMDVEGFVPLAFVGSFQAVYSVHQDYESLLEAMKSSETLELDEQNETIRLRDGWQKWVWPNADGGYGVPKYVKTVEDAESA